MVNEFDPRKAFAPLAALLLATAPACGGSAPAPALQPAARVRVVADGLPPGWHAAETGTVGDCLMLMVPQPPENPTRLIPVSLEQVADLRVSSLFDGRAGPQGAPRAYTAGADTTGEEWLRVDLEALRRAHGDCVPLIP